MTNFRAYGKRLLCLVCAAVCLLTLAAPASALLQPQAEATESAYTCLVRNRASAGSAVIGQMEDGTNITVLDESGDFYKIDCYDMTGYIAKTQVRQKQTGEYSIHCIPGAKDTAAMAYTTLADALQTRSSLLALAKEQLGYPYVYGGKSPGGFDCSGLTYYLYDQHDVSLHRCADEQMQDGLIVSGDALQVGDLLFFREAGTPWLASHVGIYVGNGKMIHAGSSGIAYADLSASYYENYFLCARRILNVDVAAVDTIPGVTTPTAARSVSNGLRTAP